MTRRLRFSAKAFFLFYLFYINMNYTHRQTPIPIKTSTKMNNQMKSVKKMMVSVDTFAAGRFRCCIKAVATKDAVEAASTTMLTVVERRSLVM